MLCSLYFAFKYLGPLWINRALSAYFMLAGLGALAKASITICSDSPPAGVGLGVLTCGGVAGFRLEWRWCDGLCRRSGGRARRP